MRKKKEKSEYEQRKGISEGEKRKAVIDKYGPDKIMYKRNSMKEKLEIWVYIDYFGMRMKTSF